MARTRRWSPATAVTAVATCMIAVAMGCARAPVADTSRAQEIVEGRNVYLQRCASCHGIEGRGDGPVAPALRTTPTDLTRLAAATGTFPVDRVVAVVAGEIAVPAHGTREMPVWCRRFGPSSGATAAASLWSTRHLNLLTTYLEAMQER